MPAVLPYALAYSTAILPFLAFSIWSVVHFLQCERDESQDFRWQHSIGLQHDKRQLYSITFAWMP